MSFTRILVLASALAAVLAVSGCGVKPTELDPPPGSDPAEVRDPRARIPPPKEGEQPDRPFILDGLLM